jgi:hypothetical protein
MCGASTLGDDHPRNDCQQLPSGNNFEAISLGVPLRGELLVSWQDYLNNGTRCLELAERATEGALQEILFEVASEWLKLAQESRKPSWSPEPTVAGGSIH